MLLSCQKATAAVPEEGEMIVEIFSNMLNGEGAMQPRHVCSVDQHGKGTLMWALGCGFSDGPQGALTLAECNAFLPTLKRVLEVFVTLCGAPIDQRFEHGKTMLMFMAGRCFDLCGWLTRYLDVGERCRGRCETRLRENNERRLRSSGHQCRRDEKFAEV